MRGSSSRPGWALGRSDSVTVALLIVAVVAALWFFVAGIGESVAWIVAATAGVAGALRLQRRSLKSNRGRPLLYGSATDGSGQRPLRLARRVLLAVVGRADSPLQPLLVACVFAAVVGSMGSTLVAGLSVLDPTAEMLLGEMIAKAGYLTLAMAAVSGVVVGAVVAIVAATATIRRMAHRASSPVEELDTASIQPHRGGARRMPLRQRRNGILIAACAAGVVGGTAGGAAASVIVLQTVAAHPSNAYGPGVHFLLSVSTATLLSLAASAAIVISPNLRACAESLSQDPASHSA